MRKNVFDFSAKHYIFLNRDIEGIKKDLTEILNNHYTMQFRYTENRHKKFLSDTRIDYNDLMRAISISMAAIFGKCPAMVSLFDNEKKEFIAKFTPYGENDFLEKIARAAIKEKDMWQKVHMKNGKLTHVVILKLRHPEITKKKLVLCIVLGDTVSTSGLSPLELNNFRTALSRELHSHFHLKTLQEWLLQALRWKDNYSGFHSRVVGEWAYKITRKLIETKKILNNNYANPNVNYLCGIYHDIGKIAVPNDILNLPRQFHLREFVLMHSHDTVGSDVLGEPNLEKNIELKLLNTIKQVCNLHHKEFSDLSDEQKIYPVCLISILDMLHAAATERPYKKGKTMGGALCETFFSEAKKKNQETVIKIPAVSNGVLSGLDELSWDFFVLPYCHREVDFKEFAALREKTEFYRAELFDWINKRAEHPVDQFPDLFKQIPENLYWGFKKRKSIRVKIILKNKESEIFDSKPKDPNQPNTNIFNEFKDFITSRSSELSEIIITKTTDAGIDPELFETIYNLTLARKDTFTFWTKNDFRDQYNISQTKAKMELKQTIEILKKWQK